MFEFHRAHPPTTRDGDTLLFPLCLNEEGCRDCFAKWGFLQSGEWSLQQYRYSNFKRETPAQGVPSAFNDSAQLLRNDAAGQPNAVTAAALRFHHGMACDFLRSLFACSTVQSQLSGAVPDASTTLSFQPLTCHWTTLEPLRRALVDARVVREVQSLSDNAAAQSQRPSGADVRLPTVKCAEELLPHGEVICDELRALFLQAHSRSCVGGLNSEENDVGSEDYADDDEDAWGGMSGAKLPLRQLRGVFEKSARRELVYHLMWRLIAGSGPLNQFEDDAAVYLDVTRRLYRALITSFHVREVAASESNAERDGDDVAALESPSELLATTRYEPLIDALVYEVFSVPGMRLFPSSDGVAPSNLNYCYVVVNPAEQTVCVWYHHC
ncbi:hypothetical protein ABL78_7168 [Leptomonas seymouri]|uniref:Cilia- and flagella-associated protein 300 n=1 Tax=Leptomonas seymouri TaxID=5684 RepID=A0A0N0P369_LEPSE|nr:hypothetical protein ABL78_7168 [Leptomonas seymouri]|eukprot:KPI83786.1 hypothetical protein ABL78_7168 [Leptomonas seymouri]